MDAPRRDPRHKPETKASLQGSPPKAVTAIGVDTFSVIVLRLDPRAEHGRQVRAFGRVLQTSHIDAEFQTTRAVPFVVKRGLTLSDALLAQFELICCDIISVFINDTVMSNASPEYLAALYRILSLSAEFATVSVTLRSVPRGAAGAALVRQFLSDDPLRTPHTITTTHKKAKIMRHWANKIGADVAEVAP